MIDLERSSGNVIPEKRKRTWRAESWLGTMDKVISLLGSLPEKGNTA